MVTLALGMVSVTFTVFPLQVPVPGRRLQQGAAFPVTAQFG